MNVAGQALPAGGGCPNTNQQRARGALAVPVSTPEFAHGNQCSVSGGVSWLCSTNGEMAASKRVPSTATKK
jgi:hypothetical protein